MARSDKTASRLEILVLSSLARQPMHGYEIKLEFQFKHVRWWAKAEHGHIYATLARLEKRGYIEVVPGEPTGGRKKKTYGITATGRTRLRDGLHHVGSARDATMFDIDLFVSGSFLLPLEEVLAVLDGRSETLGVQLAEARELKARMSPYIPAAGHLIIEHRIDHLVLELAYARKVAEGFRAQASWGSFLGDQRIEQFLERTGADIEGNGP